MAPQIYQAAPKWRSNNYLAPICLRSWSNLTPKMPPEAPLVTFFMICEEMWVFSGFILNDFQ